MHGDSASCRGRTTANGPPIKFNCSSRAAALVWTECMGLKLQSLKYCKCMGLELCLILVKSFVSSAPTSLPYHIPLCHGEMWLRLAWSCRWKVKECRAHRGQQQNSRYCKANGVRVPHFQKSVFCFTAGWMRWILTFCAHVTIGLRSTNDISKPWLWMLVWFIAKR